MKISFKDFFSKCDQIWSFLEKSKMENFMFCSVYGVNKSSVTKKRIFQKVHIWCISISTRFLLTLPPRWSNKKRLFCNFYFAFRKTVYKTSAKYKCSSIRRTMFKDVWQIFFIYWVIKSCLLIHINF